MKTFLEQIAREAGEIVRDGFGKPEVPQEKSGPLDVVTETDLATNTLIVDAIRAKFPDHGIVSEEAEAINPESEWVWTVDPLDGTLNFSRRIPLFAVMISLCHKKKPVHAAIYDVMQNELFTAAAGEGAFRNGEKIQASSKSTMTETFGVLGGRMPKNILSSWGKIRSISPASAGISAVYLADGRCDWWITKGGYVWDYAPAALILKEAGCVVTNLKGEPWSLEDRTMLAANSIAHKQLLDSLSAE